MRNILLTALVIIPALAFAGPEKPNPLDPSYRHDRWETSNHGILREFTAYTSSFDDDDDDNGDGSPDVWGVPEWVAYEIKRYNASCLPKNERPSWFTDKDLNKAGIMPADNSYEYKAAFKEPRPSWFSRGHLAMKMHAERLGPDAGWNTHVFFNAVPQRQPFNAGIWLDMEDLTAAWAQHYGAVWIITGPIFVDRSPYAYVGEPGEVPVAIPEALFKIVVKEGAQKDKPDVLAFIYPQIGPGYSEKPFNHMRYIATIDEIEELTGLDFLMSLPDGAESKVEKMQAANIWDYERKDFISTCRSR